MKIGIITFHCSYNFGSVLQAYALCSYINKKYASAQVIDFVQKEDFEQYRLFRTALYKKQPKSFFSDIVYLKRNLKRKNNFESFVHQNIPLTQKKYFSINELKTLNSEYDVFICGSDQIWNPVCTKGVEPAYYLLFVDDTKKKIAYAPSIAHLSIDPHYIPEMEKYISRLDAVSVREESTAQLVRKIVNKPVSVVVDPTLLLNKDDYRTLLKSVNEKNYIFVYMLEISDDLIKYATWLSSVTHKKIIYVAKKNQKEYINGKNVYGIGPDEFLSFIEFADYVVTNSFHATVFSFLFRKQFVTFKTKLSSARMIDLLTNLGIDSRIYRDQFDIDAPIDFESANERLAIIRCNSEKYLEKNINRYE